MLLTGQFSILCVSDLYGEIYGRVCPRKWGQLVGVMRKMGCGLAKLVGFGGSFEKYFADIFVLHSQDLLIFRR